MTTIEAIAFIAITVLAVGCLVLMAVSVIGDIRRNRLRRLNDRIAEEATAIIAALCTYDQIKENQEGFPKEKEVKDEEDKAV